MKITLSQFERIDGLMMDVLRMGDNFAAMSDDEMRAYSAANHRLDDAMIEAVGFDFVGDFGTPVECAANIVTLGLLGQIAVVDEVAA